MLRSRSRTGFAVLGLLALALALAAPAAAEEVWMPPTHFVAAGFNPFPWPTSGSGFASFGLAVPDDFGSFVGAKVVLIPKANVAGSYDVYGSVKRAGEVAGAGLLFNLAIPANLPAGTVGEIDVSPLFAAQFDPTSAGSDYVSVFFWFPAGSALQDATVLGMRFAYDPIPLAAAEIGDGAVTGAKLAGDAVDSSKVANESLTGADVQNGSLSGADLGANSVSGGHIVDGSVGMPDLGPGSVGGGQIQDGSVGAADIGANAVSSGHVADGTIGAADVNSAQVQQRVAGTCPAGQSIRAIASNGTVTCEPDTIGVLGFATNRFPTTVNAGLIFKASMGPCGTGAVNGGWMVNGALGEADRARIDSSGPDPANANNWQVIITNQSGSAVLGDFYLTCANITGTAGASREPTLQATQVSR